MIRNLRNLFITLSSLMGLSFVYRRFVRLTRPLVRVIVFHDVEDLVWFKQCLTTIKDHYHVISPEDFVKGSFDSNGINVLITFDDGYASWTEKCLPLLKEENIQGVFFINSGLIDASGDESTVAKFIHDRLLLTSPRKTLSWEGVQLLTRNSHLIGGHTVTHARLSELQEVAQKAEVEEDRDRITAMIQSDLLFFAYPFGRVSDMTTETEHIVRDARYRYGFTTDASFVSFKNPYAISRLCIEDGLSERQLRQWIEGGYDIYAKIKQLCVG